MPMSEESFVSYCESLGYLQLSLKNEHIFNLKSLTKKSDEVKHNDPFDRLI